MQDTDPNRLKEIQTQLLKTAKLASIGEMAGGIAHEINNPLSIISASSRVIQNLTVKCSNSLSSPQTDSEDIEAILCALSRATKTIDNTVDRISSIVSGMQGLLHDKEIEDSEEVEVDKLIEQTLSLCTEKIRSHSIELNVTNEISKTIRCNSTQISQILVNLLNNSIYAVENKEERWIQIESKLSNNQIQIRVSDSGDGVPSAKLSKIFDPFYTTKPPGKGTGLGLSIASEIAKSHGGQLYYDQNEKHSTFVLSLPITDIEKAVS